MPIIQIELTDSNKDLLEAVALNEGLPLQIWLSINVLKFLKGHKPIQQTDDLIPPLLKVLNDFVRDKPVGYSFTLSHILKCEPSLMKKLDVRLRDTQALERPLSRSPGPHGHVVYTVLYGMIEIKDNVKEA